MAFEIWIIKIPMAYLTIWNYDYQQIDFSTDQLNKTLLPGIGTISPTIGFSKLEFAGIYRMIQWSGVLINIYIKLFPELQKYLKTKNNKKYQMPILFEIRLKFLDTEAHCARSPSTKYENILTN